MFQDSPKRKYVPPKEECSICHRVFTYLRQHQTTSGHIEANVKALIAKHDPNEAFKPVYDLPVYIDQQKAYRIKYAKSMDDYLRVLREKDAEEGTKRKFTDIESDIDDLKDMNHQVYGMIRDMPHNPANVKRLKKRIKTLEETVDGLDRRLQALEASSVQTASSSPASLYVGNAQVVTKKGVRINGKTCDKISVIIPHH